MNAGPTTAFGGNARKRVWSSLPWQCPLHDEDEKQPLAVVGEMPAGKEVGLI
jgi:hypothetical protein